MIGSDIQSRVDFYRNKNSFKKNLLSGSILTSNAAVLDESNMHS